MYRKTLTAFLLLFSVASFSQFKMEGEFRTRGIINNGYKIPALKNSEPIFSADQRSRLILNYRTDKYSTRFTIQDARVWGSDDMISKTGTEGNSYSLGIHEAWVDFKLNNKASLKIGRQEWNYNDMRIISQKNWWASGLSYDAILLKRDDSENGLFIDLGISYNNNGKVTGAVDNTDWDMYKIKSMSFVNIEQNIGNKASLAAMLNISTKVDTSSGLQLATGTHGLFFNYNNTRDISDGLFVSSSVYYQHGTDINKGTNGKYKSIQAYLIAAEAGYRAFDKKMEVSAGVELISGHDHENTSADYNNTRHSFDLLYGSRFPYYGGNMNHFVYQESYLLGTKGGGYFNPSVKVKYKINDKNGVVVNAGFPQLTTKVKAHTSIDAATSKPIGAEKDYAGNQIYWSGSLGNYFDMEYTHKFSKTVVMKAGVSVATISDIKNQMTFGYDDVAAKKLHNADLNYLGWVMLVVKPTFFDSSNK